ncbi:MAG: type II secretion system F family protein, partial [Planctomycetaceae bacterium]|nr:type II secretion system F family protein [Planctomycetaceae bacterium]
MNLELAVPWAVFGTITCGIWAVAGWLSGGRSRETERLDELRDPRLRQRGGGDQKSGMGAMLERAAPKLSKALEPKTELEASTLKVRLANAGYSSPNAPQLYLALKVSLLAVGVIAGSAYGLTVFGLTQNGLTAMVLAGGGAFYLPE